MYNSSSLSELSGQSPHYLLSNSKNPNVPDKSKNPKASKQIMGCRSSTGDLAHIPHWLKGVGKRMRYNARVSSTRLKYCDMRLSTKDPVINFIK